MTEKPHSTIRIVDIARMAGVSTATVDRVIHHRGKVSQTNLRKIREVLDSVDYHPNLAARSLASCREQVIAVLIPAYREGEYWADVDAGICRAASEAARFNVRIRRYFFDQYDRQSFERALTLVHDEHFDAVLIATLFSEMVMRFTHELDAQGIPYVFVDSNIPGCNQLAYFGTSSFDAGVVAARLLTDRMERDADILVASVVHKSNGGSNQCRNRELGFRAYLREAKFCGKLHLASLRLDDEQHNARVLDELLRRYPRIAGAVTFNSTCYLLGSYLSAARRSDVRVVGYDIIRRNRDMLASGVVTALIAQRPEAQGYYGVTALTENLTGGRKVPRVNHMPIDILLKENIRFYKNNII